MEQAKKVLLAEAQDHEKLACHAETMVADALRTAAEFEAKITKHRDLARELRAAAEKL
ncbi:hypothetical protein MMZ06_34875 [Burkholderia gladioli]|uniref:hypothetical protein n=1 Tax=Burkholderia gladioli TaxID=28095 RepID=UPI001905797F|nr:hypothetical protein [Burkholderia gladioli]MBJ9709868.1 hypothetical protein [Burkholderia gladioli]MCH7275020.1 hypothetical protein [Burkholderia gladioli]